MTQPLPTALSRLCHRRACRVSPSVTTSVTACHRCVVSWCATITYVVPFCIAHPESTQSSERRPFCTVRTDWLCPPPPAAAAAPPSPDAWYDDPLGPLEQRLTHFSQRPGEDEWDEELGDDLLPE